MVKTVKKLKTKRIYCYDIFQNTCIFFQIVIAMHAHFKTLEQK